MTEEKNGLSHGPANTEMAPQEDGTKVPLTDEPGQVKFSSNPPNGDAKIDISDGQTFSGLTKEELMKYADDPFWVRMRWVLFILFWAGWVAMLVMAIVIIVQAPRCTPKETLHWVQESAMIQYDVNNPVDANSDGQTNPEDMVNMAKALGMTTVYLEELISDNNFEELSNIYNSKTELEEALKAAREAGLHVVTDFVPSSVPTSNNWFINDSLTEFFIPGTDELDFSNENLLNNLTELFSTTWKDRGVLGYLVGGSPDETLINATVTITNGLTDVDGAVVYGLEDVNHQLNGFTAESYKEFLENSTDVWSYFKFNPKLAESELKSNAMAKLVTLTLFLVPGTPILHSIEEDYLNAEKDYIQALSEYREKESVQVGNMAFANTTSEDVIAYARVMKGTPGCAVAVNFHSSNGTEVDFTSIKGVPGKGDIHLTVNNGTHVSGELGRAELSKVYLEPLGGVVVLFVPDLE